MNTQLKLILYIVLVVGMFYFIQDKYSLFDISFDKEKKQEEEKKGEIDSIEIVNGDGKSILVQVEIADSVEARSLGLSGRNELGDYQGMLFVMDEEDSHPFWMKDMNISLDVIFINSQGYIVDIFDNQEPCEENFCPTIQSPSLSRYVLEVKSGFCEINRVGVGNEVIFDISSEV